MYMRGNLVNLAASILGKSRPEDLSTLNDAERRMLSRNLKGLQIHVVHRGESGSKKRFKVLPSPFFGSDHQIVGLSTDPAASIQFEEDPEEGKTGKKKISLVDYFYVKVSHSTAYLKVVQSPPSTTWFALHHRQEEHFLAYGGNPSTC